MSSGENNLYDPHIHPPPTQMATYPPPSEPAPQYQPAPPSFHTGPGYQPVAQQSSNNTTVAVVNSAPMATSYTVDPSTVPPPNYLVLNVVTLLCCCFLFGLIGLLYSVQVESQWSRGDYQGAMSSSRTAKNWGIAGLVTGSVLIGGTVLLNVIAFAVSAGSASSTSNDDY